VNGNKLRCPHGLPVTVISEKGMTVYLHKEDGAYCPALNTFETTPEDVLRVMMQSILDNDEFMGFDENQGSRYHEFAIMFKRSADVRERVYKKIAALSAGGAARAKKLFGLVLLVLSDARSSVTEREFKNLISDFFLCYGLAFEKAFDALQMTDKERFSALRAEIAFQKKYEHKMQQNDLYDISLWAR
jgi:hypothetical protein